MSARTLQHIISSQQEPTEEERAYAQPFIEAWYEHQLTSLREKLANPPESGPLSGYYVSIILQTEKPTLDKLRQDFASVREFRVMYGTVGLTEALKQLDEIAGKVFEKLDPYVYAQPDNGIRR